MRIYTVHEKSGLSDKGAGAADEAVPVKEGFSWRAFILSPLWALWHRLWLAAIVFFLANMVLSQLLVGFGANEAARGAASLALALIIGWTANDFRRRKLNKLGFRERAVVIAGNKETALQRYMETRSLSSLPNSRAGGPW